MSDATDSQAKSEGQLNPTGKAAHQWTTTKGFRWLIGPLLQSLAWAAANTPSEYQINTGKNQ